jgi:hypothetical protein
MSAVVNNSQIPKIEKTEGAINSEQFGDIGKEKTEGAINNEQFLAYDCLRLYSTKTLHGIHKIH